jgi:porin
MIAEQSALLPAGKRTKNCGTAPPVRSMAAAHMVKKESRRMMRFGRNGQIEFPLIVVWLATLTPAISRGEEAQPGPSTTQPSAETRPAPKEKNAQPPFFRLDYSGDFWHSPAMTGDWGGARTKLAENGISFNVETLQYVQGNAHGGVDQNNAFRYGGHSDFFLQLDTYRMGLWPGGYFKVSGETQWGQGIANKVGSILPPNFATLLLESGQPGGTALSEYYMMQFLSPKIGVIAGMVDLTQLPGSNVFFSDRYGQFMNTGFWFNPVAFSTVPLAAMTAGAIYMPTDWLSGATLVVDDHGRPTRSGFETGFHGPTGVTILQTATLTVKPFGQTGHQRFNISLSTRDHLALEDIDRLVLSGLTAPSFSRLNLPRTIVVGGRNWRLRNPILRAGLSRVLEPNAEGGDWGLWYDFDQYLYTSPNDKDQGFGLFGSFGWGNPKFNPVNTFYSVGLGGKGLVPDRAKDRYGLGYFCMSISDQMPSILDAQKEQGAELFYNVEITPWLHITPDLQVLIDPTGSDRYGTALVYGLRMQMSF